MKSDQSIICPDCKENIPKKSKFCPECGSALNTCPICQKQILKHENLAKCPYCEAKFHLEHILNLLKTSNLCPNCKKAIKETQLT